MQIKNSQPTPTHSQLKEALKGFIHEHDPKTHYMFEDSEKENGVSELCKEGTSGRDCIKLNMNTKEMFKAMQDQGFFCALPADPERTDMHCKPLPKN